MRIPALLSIVVSLGLATGTASAEELKRHVSGYVPIDASMGKVNGYQFCALVKTQTNYQYIPLIIVLEYANKFDQAKALAAGANAVLVKPFGKNELLDVVNLPGAKAA